MTKAEIVNAHHAIMRALDRLEPHAEQDDKKYDTPTSYVINRAVRALALLEQAAQKS